MSESDHHHPQVDPEHPWPGLVAFSEETRHYFFGREREEDELLRRIRREVTTLLFGQSGLGKTSLLQAGLAARLREQGFVPVPVRLSYGDGATSPLEQLRSLFREALTEEAPNAPQLGEDETLWEYLHRREPEPSAPGEGRPVPVLLIDQFEEVFTLGRSKAPIETGLLLTELTDMIENRCPAAVKARLERDNSLIEGFSFERSDYRIVLAIREDYLPHLDTLRTRAPSLERNRFRLTRMDGGQALDAVVQPGGGLIGAEVAEQIVRHIAQPRLDDPFEAANAGGEAPLAELEVDPPLLSLFCNELNARRIRAHNEQITSEIVDLNKDRILRDFYEASFRGLPARLRVFVEDDLVTDSGLRDNLALEQAEKRLGRWPRLRKALAELVRRRLLHVEERSNVPRIELIHDLLIPVAVESRKRRRKRRMRLLLGAGLAVILLAISLSAAYSWWVGEQREQGSRTFALRASQCEGSPDSPACAALVNVEERTLRGVPDTDVGSTLLGFLQVANGRFAAGEIGLSRALLGRADTLLAGREGYDLVRAAVLARIGDQERRLGLRKDAIDHSDSARSLYLEQLQAARAGADVDPGLVDQIIFDLASLDLRLALLVPRNRAALLREALAFERELVVGAEQMAGGPRPSESAKRQLIVALGNRSFAHVLLGNWRAALEDVSRAERLAGGTLRPDGEFAWILTNRGDAHLLAGRVDQAIRVFESIATERGLPPNSQMCGDILDDLNWLWEMQPQVRSGIEQVRTVPALRNCVLPRGVSR